MNATEEDITLEEAVVDILKEKKLTVTTVESCTAGLLAGRLMNVPGASAVFNEGYIKAFEEIQNENQGILRISLKYTEKGKKVISGLKRISKPGLRIYASKEELPKVLNGLGIALISTSKGIMTDRKARELGVGGEVLAYIW